MVLIKNKAEKIRFGLVGAANTVLDFAILFILVGLGLDKLISNYISTGVAFIFSFFINKSFTFKDATSKVAKQFILFIIVTITGLWIIQPIIILAITHALTPFEWNEGYVLLVAKLIATLASLVWNYLFYSRVVFTRKNRSI